MSQSAERRARDRKRARKKRERHRKTENGAVGWKKKTEGNRETAQKMIGVWGDLKT